ncbi:hypothetical protein FFF34_011950 [Inquilinus sp. KBS0705]|nr:hypothetical protein FFF34_011950 [Inquilinus sp. KBS0705]
MGKKIALNVALNLGIFLAVLIGYTALEHQRYEYVLACTFIAVLLIVFKIKLIKGIRNSQKNP